jgi:YhcH/YjgK/YiaL family protein
MGDFKLIIDKLSNANLYYGLHPRIKKGLEFLIENDVHSLKPGKHEIEGPNLFVIIQEYETIQVEQGRWESHYKYTDIQLMIHGEEQMGYANVEDLEVVEEHKEKDRLSLEGNGTLLLVNQGSFAIFSPEDAHMPTLCVHEPQYIKKAVVKLLWD